MKTTTSLRLRLKALAPSTQQPKRQMECGSPGWGTQHSSAAFLIPAVNRMSPFLSRWHGLLAGCVMLSTSAHALTLSGRVTDDGLGLSGIRINYSWVGPLGGTDTGFVTTDANGNWSSPNWGPATSITLTPAQSAGYSWSPANRPVSTGAGLSDIGGLNFERTSYSISGTVRGGNDGVGGVVVTLSGAMNISTTTSPNGTYSFVRLRTGTYTITPSHAAFRFLPTNLITTLAPSRTGQDFRLNPLAATLPATNIGFGLATLNGSVMGDGTAPTRVWFEYGAGTNLNLKTATNTLPASTNVTLFSAIASNLSGGLKYSYRLAAANTHGTNYGASMSFLMPFLSAGGAMSFNGTSAYVSAGTNPVLKVTTNLTIEAWINPTGPGSGSSGSGGVIAGREGEYMLARFADGTIRYALSNVPPSAAGYINTAITTPLNEWTHVALTYAVIGPSSQLRLYTNGVLAFGAIGPRAIATTSTQNDFRIGGRQAAFSQFFHGQIDEVRIWDSARTPTEITNNFQRRLTGSESRLLAYFKFDEGLGASTDDSGPNPLTGTLLGGATFVTSGARLRDPVAITRAASPVLATRATLQASVNPSEVSTTAYFEYGETTAYGLPATPGQDVGSGLASVPVSASIENLQPGTTYHYRSVAFNAFGTTYGEDQTFTTLVLGVGWPASTKVTGGFSRDPKHAVDAEGNTYVAGLFSGTATFRTTLNSSNANPEAFVAKMGRGADWLWESKVISSNGAIAVTSIALDVGRNVYIAGQFSGTASFGTNVLTAVGQTDAFVAKLSSLGDAWLWARSAGAAQSDSANALAVTPAGNIFVAGHFRGSTVSFGTTNLSSAAGSQDIFVASLNSNGAWLWARSAGGAGQNDTALALALNSASEAFLTGTFQGANAVFGTVTNQASGGLSDTDLFIARINTNGLWLLARRAGGAGADAGTGLAVDGAGNVYLVGQFGGTADYSGSMSNLNLGAQARLFVARLNPNCNILWYAQGGAGFCDSIAADNLGQVFVSGEFGNPVVSTSFGDPAVTNLVSSGNLDVFVARLDASSGSWVWARKIGSTGSETRGSIGVDGQGGIVVSGTFQGTVPVGFVLLTTSNERDIFMARLDSNGIFEHNSYVIGQAIPVPLEAQRGSPDDGGAIDQPTISILEKEHADSDALNSFVWSIAEHKLFPVRPVTAIIKWPLAAGGTNTTSVATAVGRSVWPSKPQLHVANTPVELEPAVSGFPYRFVQIAFTTINGASVESGSKQFTARQEGWTVLQFLDTGGQLPDPTIHPSRFEVPKTILLNATNPEPATIGTALTPASHNDPTGKNGFVYFERAFYDGTGEEKSYDRSTRTGPIIPVNKDTAAADDDLVVVWYRTNLVTGIAWPSLAVRYLAQWPTNAADLVLASGEGSLSSGVLDELNYPSKRVYNQPDAALAGFNPNEEHAALYDDVLYALRNDLNGLVNASEPYTLLKYRHPDTDQWTMKVYRVVTTNATNQFVYSGEAGQQLELPAPLSLLPLCGPSNTWVSGPAFKDHQGRLYARAAGLNNGDAAIVTRYWYPLQPGFFYDLDRNGQPDAPVGDCVPWLDHRPGGVLGVPVSVTYNITWPSEVLTLQIGETLFRAKFGLPDLRSFAHARIVFDEGDPGGIDGAASLARLFDPLAPRTVQLRPENADDFITGPGYSVFRVENADALFDGISSSSDMGMRVFTDLPFSLRSRLRYDPLSKNLIFRGLLDESEDYGGPDNALLLLNVLSPRERNRIQDLSGNSTFDQLIDALYNLTRNPNQLNLDDEDGPDTALLVGLTQNEAGQVLPEVLGSGPKVLSAGSARTSGYVTVVENDDASLGGLPVKLHVIRLADGPYRGDMKVIQSDNVFDEKLTLRHSADFGGEPQRFEFEWYYRPADSPTNASRFPIVLPNGDLDLRGWTRYSAFPPGVIGVNDITLGDGSVSSLLVLADNYFICRYRGYVINGLTNWSDWVGIIGGGQAQIAEGWVKRVRDGLNPFETRTREFHQNETVTFASMLQQAGTRYEGDIAFSGGGINQIGLIEAYETVLRRAKHLSVDGTPPVRYQPANEALLLAAGFIADLYMLLGNEAVADAADPTIGFRTSSAGYGTLAPSIFTFQNQLDSLLEEEVTLLRGRDDRSASVRVPPVYNRLFWNFTRDEGEVAYAQAYNITDQNSDGVIDAADARVMYPQSHGDAWGHYLTATKTYYSLLQNPNFDWLPRSEEILLSGSRVEVDYLDERKFARAAAAKAKTGAEIVDLTYRLNYVDDPAGQYQGYKDTDPERAWGVSEWAHRAGSAAIFDWVIVNAILPAVDPDPANAGLAKIDRTTVAEIDEIAAGYESVQAQIDKADAGLNPLGLAKNVVPFDIDPALIDSGKTHFEQIYDRAIEAMKNSVTVFDHANQLSQALRGLQDSVNNFSQNVDQQERDYKNRLIEIFGYPYPGDIGAGKTYPAGYDGPDLYHYMYVNPVEFTGDPEALVTNMVGGIASPFKAFFAPLKKGIVGLIGHFFPKDLPVGVVLPATTNALEIAYPVAASDYSFSAPPEWGRRRAPGELQNALSELLQAESQLKRARINHNNHVLEMEDKADLLQAKYDLEAEKLLIKAQTKAEVLRLKAVLVAAREINKAMKKVEKNGGSITDAIVESFPKSIGTSTDATSTLRGAAKFANIAKNLVVRGIRFLAERTAEQQKEMIESVEGKEKERIEDAEFGAEVQKELKEIEKMLREEKAFRLEMLAQAQKLDQVAGNYEAAVAKGLRLIEERIAFRKNAAAETQSSRYQDMTFRIFRNDAIQKYRAQFDVAAKYVFLAAVAYDYETQLLGDRSGAGRAFLTDIVRQRALGEVINGVPVAGRHGLADPLARLNQNFGVLKGQLGFNNPQTETDRFSLRKGLLRLRDNDASDEQWRAELKKRIVPNLWDIPEFRRYCRPFAPESAGPQPGLVIRFPTTINFGFNYFGWPLGGGDSAYDPTLFATKVRSAGVWFSDYNDNGLSFTPRLYLIPAGADVMRSPSGNNLEIREWRVVDQKIPVPFPIGFSSLNNPAWIPINDSLSDTFADVRRFSSFRAYHDTGDFVVGETTTDSRLIGRSVWNTDWMLIIPGGTFLFDPNQGLETFIDSVSDIKIFFQTYAYSGN
jgi:hypothetical protein